MTYFNKFQHQQYNQQTYNKKYAQFKELDEVSQPKNIISPKNTNIMKNNKHSMIWVSNVNEMKESKSYWDFFMSILSQDERKKVEAFRLESDRWRSFLSIQLQKSIIRSYIGTNRNDDGSYEIRRTKENKPYAISRLKSLNKWNYNVSHHGDYVAIASHENFIIGVDVMTLTKPKSRYVQSDDAYFAIFKNHFAAKEMANILEQPTEDERYRMFFINWSLKESFVKAIGCGISFELQNLCFEITMNENNTLGNAVLRMGDFPAHAAIQSKWRFKFYMLDDTHVMSVALGPTQEVIESYSKDAWYGDSKNTITSSSSSNQNEAPFEAMSTLSQDEMPETEPEMSSPPKRNLNPNYSSSSASVMTHPVHCAEKEINVTKNDPFQLPAWELRSVESLLSEEDFARFQTWKSTNHA